MKRENGIVDARTLGEAYWVAISGLGTKDIDAFPLRFLERVEAALASGPVTADDYARALFVTRKDLDPETYPLPERYPEPLRAALSEGTP